MVEAWKIAASSPNKPVALVLTRQALPTFDRTKYAPASGVKQGAYILADAPDGKPDVILMATGSEVSLCISAYEQLTKRWYQGPRSQHAVVGPVRKAERGLQKASLSARSKSPRVGRNGLDLWLGALRRPTRVALGMHRFGASAPIKDLLKKFGFTTENVVSAAKKAIVDAKSAIASFASLVMQQEESRRQKCIPPESSKTPKLPTLSWTFRNSANRSGWTTFAATC